MITCKICGKEYKDLRVLGCHIIKAHKIPTKDYYDKYMATEWKHDCKQCGKPTSFLNMNVGYRPFCCNKCSMEYLKTNPEAIENAKIATEQTFKNKYGGHPMQNDTVKHKMMKTVNDKYGGNISFKDANVKAKSDATMLKEYGTTSAFNSKVIKERAKDTIINKYGVDNVFKLKEIQDKLHNTHLEKYGNEHIAAVPEIREKIQNTVKEKYGVDHVMHNLDISKKVSESKILKADTYKLKSMEKYGVPYPSQASEIRIKLTAAQNNPETKSKRRITLIQNYGEEHPPRKYNYIYDDQSFDSTWEVIFYKYHHDILNDDIRRNKNEYFIYHVDDKEYRYYPDFYLEGKYYEVKGSHLLDEEGNLKPSAKDNIEKVKAKNKCLHDNNVILVTKSDIDSMLQKIKDVETIKYMQAINNAKKRLINFIVNELKISNIKSHFKFENEIYSLYLPDNKILIDIIDIVNYSYINKNVFLYKLRRATAEGLRYIAIYSDELLKKEPIVAYRLASILGKLNIENIYARNCQVVEISNIEARNFLNSNHIQGSCNAIYNLALKYKDEIVSLMTLGKSRFKPDEIELLRFCNLKGTRVIGGASKLLTFFIKNRTRDIKEIISYADRRWSDGNLYYKLGFNLDKTTPPSYYYVHPDMMKRENRITYQKARLVKKGFDKNKTEEKIMTERGYRRIYDCGQFRFVKKLD